MQMNDWKSPFFPRNKKEKQAIHLNHNNKNTQERSLHNITLPKTYFLFLSPLGHSTIPIK